MNKDEVMTNIRESLPRVWWNLYQGCLSAGFDDKVSLSLTQTFILAQNPFGIHPTEPDGPPNQTNRSEL